MSQKGVRFNPEVKERIGKPENAYSRGTHNNSASRAEVQRQLAAAGYHRYSTSGNEIARAGQYSNNFSKMMSGMSGLSLHGKGRRTRRTRRRRHISRRK
jgi:hypothetical protein